MAASRAAGCWRLRDLKQGRDQASGIGKGVIEKGVELLRINNPSLDLLLARLLFLRGVAPTQVDDFLHPKMKHLLPNPSLLADMDKAVERLLHALRNDETLGIITDYDVDGASCAAMFASYWRALGGSCVYTIPERASEGYGPSLAAFTRLRAQGATGVVLTTDCGTNAEDIFTQATAQHGWDVIVLDHHEIPPRADTTTDAPSATFAIINPQRKDNAVDVSSLSACGVVFMLLIALRRRVLAEGIVSSPPPLKPWLDVVALATICDVVALSPLNRAFVRAGLAELGSARHVGLAMLARLGDGGKNYERAIDANGNRKYSTRDLAFFFGPRLNACGRMGEEQLAVELLLCVDASSAKRARVLAHKIEKLNRERRELQDACCARAFALAEEEHGCENSVCFFSDPSWAVGVLGPAASRVAEKLHRPTFLANEALAKESLAVESPTPSSAQDFLRGSARLPQEGWENVNLAQIVSSAQTAGLLLSAGGHARACGFTLRRETFAKFKDFLNAAIDKSLDVEVEAKTDSVANSSIAFRGFVDMELLPSAVSRSLVENISCLAPFGRGNEEPRFAFRDVFVDDCRFVGNGRHLVCSLSVQGGVARARAIAFNIQADGGLAQGGTTKGLADALLDAADTRRPQWLVGKVRLDGYSNQGQIVIEDFACVVDGMD